MDAAAQFFNDSLLAYDNNEYTIAVFLDLSKALETIDHKVLLKKLEYNGIRGLALNRLQSYPSDTKQYVQFINTSSSQRTALGQLLFLICINDLPPLH